MYSEQPPCQSGIHYLFPILTEHSFLYFINNFQMQNKIYPIPSFISQQRLASLLCLANYVNFESLSGGNVRTSEEGKLQVTSNVKQLNWNLMCENEL